MSTVHLEHRKYEKQPASASRGVRNMNKQDQPREKLVRYGADVLTDTELIAILIRSGTQGMNVMETATKLLEEVGGLHRMARCDAMDISKIKGIGRVKAITLMAALEMGRRLSKGSDEERIILQQPDRVYAHFGPMMRDLSKEVFYVAYLNSAKVLEGYDKISIGGTNATIVDPPEVLRKAVMNKAHGIILLHNHPSGNTNPSRADINLTQRLVDGGKMIGVQVLDHIIVAGYEYTSFKSRGIIP
jgi:DNA repair protein RadC